MSPELWYVIASVVATLVVQAAHARGVRLPLFESILDWIGRVRPPGLPSLPNSIRLMAPDGEKRRPELAQTADGGWELHWRERG